MTDAYVLDASAILCSMLREPGHEKVESLLQGSVVSAVNYAEVMTKLQDLRTTPEVFAAIVDEFKLVVVEFDLTHALATASLRNATRARGLSLGDRACLALAASRNAIAVTTDRAWQDLPGIARVLVVR
jgi:ribonuclease VapC